MVAGEALVTGETTVSRPSNADALANFETPGLFAEVDNRAHRFVTGNQGILRHAPIIIEHGEIRMAYAQSAALEQLAQR